MTRASRRFAVLLVLAGILAGAIFAVPLIRRVIAHFELPLQFASIIRRQAREKDLDPALVAAVIYSETRFNPRTSTTGALGLMQIEPDTARFLAHRTGGTAFSVSDLGTPAVNIAYGSYYLRYLLNHYGNNTLLALAAYNGGETNVDAWLRRAKRRGRRFSVNDIPLKQTRAYVQEVFSEQRQYRSRYARQLGYST